MEISSGNPYYEYEMMFHTLRRFTKDTIESSLVWHRDKQDRLVKVLIGENWKLQIDDELPIKLEQNESYFIPKMMYHRLLKGNTDLVLEIIKE